MSKKQTYSVHELAELSGCSVRTLHHYDEVGLVRAQRAANNYRSYGQAEVDRLQQVLLYRQTGLSLKDIRRILDDPRFNETEALEKHLHALLQQREQLECLIKCVKKTLSAKKGATTMANEEKFEAFKRSLVDENEKKYGAEVRERWGNEAADASNAKTMGLRQDDYQATLDLEKRIAAAIQRGLEQGDPAGEAGRETADLHRQWLGYFWKEGMYSKEAHKGLGEMYVADERFKKHYEDIAPGGAEFMRDAIYAYCS